MLNTKKSTPVSERKNEEEQNTGKKLVQARLPFKILAGTPPSPASTTSPLADKTRKRKLSYTNANKSVIESPNSKENVVKPSLVDSTCSEVLILSDDDQQISPDISTPSHTPSSGTPKNDTPTGAEKSTTPKLQIKLPLTSKRKRSRHSSHLTKSHSNEQSESDEQRDLSKRIKLGEDLADNEVDEIDLTLENVQDTKVEDADIMLKSTDPTDEKEETSTEESTPKLGPENASTSDEDKSDVKSTKPDDATPVDPTLPEKEQPQVGEEAIVDKEPRKEPSAANDENQIQKNTVEKLEADNVIKAREQAKRTTKQQEERKNRELQRKKEREDRIEKKRREREEREEQRRREKDAKDRKRLAEVEARNEEKRKKEEAKELERRKKEDDRRRKEFEKEEEENKKKKAAQAFTKFFVAKLPNPRLDNDQESNGNEKDVDLLAFRPFQVKGDMKLAPIVRRQLTEDLQKRVDAILNGDQVEENKLYIDELKDGTHVPLKGLKTILKENDDDVVVIENELETAAQSIDEVRPKATQKCKAKFFLFHENRRPPYYGTWRKKSALIGPRRPYVVDKGFFDYEVDSDDEWEEEEPGESLNGSEDEKDESEDEDYEVDNEWFVPHGHLSDEELQNEDEITSNTSREAQKAKLIVLQNEFAQEMKKKTEKIKPRLVGVIWEDENGNRPSNCPNIIWDALNSRSMIMSELPLVKEDKETQPASSPQEKVKKFEINDELMIDLIRLVHGNRNSKVFLIKEYLEHVFRTCEAVKTGECLAPTKAMIRDKIEEISEWSVVDANNSKKKNKKKLCWVVAADVLDKYSLGQLGLHNEWTYKLQPKCINDKSDASAIDSTVLESNEKSEVHKLSKYIKMKASHSHKKKSATPSSKPNTPTSRDDVREPANSDKPSAETPTNSKRTEKKKVALLMSVAPGEQFCTKTKRSLISSFLDKSKATSKASNERKDPSSSIVIPD